MPKSKQVRTILSGLFLVFFTFSATAQQKKKIRVQELDKIRGLLFQPNTIKPYTGTAFDEFPNGKKKMQIPIKDGKLQGEAIEWAKNGKKVYSCQYEQGVQSGRETHWYATGQKKLEIPFANGKPSGTCSEWHKNGQLKSAGNFVNGLEQEEHKWWYPDGKLDQIIVYKDGKANGPTRQWHPNEQMRLETYFKNGLKEGDMKEWYMDGQLKQSGSYIADKKNASFKEWTKKGRLVRLQVFERGTIIKDHNYRNGSIRTLDGYIQVFNGMESFFTVNISGQKEVDPIQSRELTYSVDGLFLELFTRPIAPTATEESVEEKLKRFAEQEVAFIRETTDFPVEMQSQLLTTANGQPFLHWHFVSPSSKDEKQKARTVQHEHYVTMICNKQFLNLYSVVTNSDEPSQIEALVKRLAEGVEIHSERIDLNEVVKKVSMN